MFQESTFCLSYNIGDIRLFFTIRGVFVIYRSTSAISRLPLFKLCKQMNYDCSFLDLLMALLDLNTHHCIRNEKENFMFDLNNLAMSQFALCWVSNIGRNGS